MVFRLEGLQTLSGDVVSLPVDAGVLVQVMLLESWAMPVGSVWLRTDA